LLSFETLGIPPEIGGMQGFFGDFRRKKFSVWVPIFQATATI
jgi:hypothetical protein